ncbi:MAG: hypothetical protein C4518_10785 [Desulfobacteraceae bacterium]|nr:MAG: hypothetical protein C4518_10785 [Desulfobacteraceae bacterium]
MNTSSNNQKLGENGMKQCPYCKEQMQDDATTCPHCRHTVLSSNALLNFLILAVLFSAMFLALFAWFVKANAKILVQIFG